MWIWNGIVYSTSNWWPCLSQVNNEANVSKMFEYDLILGAFSLLLISFWLERFLRLLLNAISLFILSAMLLVLADHGPNNYTPTVGKYQLNCFAMKLLLINLWLCSRLLYMFVVHGMGIVAHVHHSMLVQRAKTKHQTTHSNRVIQMDWDAGGHKCRRSVFRIQGHRWGISKRFLQNNRSLDICYLFNDIFYLHCDWSLKIKWEFHLCVVLSIYFFFSIFTVTSL